MPPSYFPLRWESTGDQWWYASPIDWAAANGLHDIVKELLHLDTNLLIKLTSLRRIRRLETVWDDGLQFEDVARCRCEVAKKLLQDCETKNGQNSLIRAGYGGWLLYTAASAGDVLFVKELLVRDPLLVFGEGEYGITDIFYAAARSKDCGVFKLLLDSAMSPKGCSGNEHSEGEADERDSVFKWELMNRAIHAAARGGNLDMLKELLGEFSDVLVYRDAQGYTVLHTASGRGQIEVVKYLVASFDIIISRDDQGNTALHAAAYRGHLSVVELLISACPTLTSLTNNIGDSFLHMAVAGFRSPGFRRLDQQIELMKQLLSGKMLNLCKIVNIRNNDGRTALHMAVLENIKSDVVQLLMNVPSIDLNIQDGDSLTPLDLLKKQPKSAASEILIKQLISAGGISDRQDFDKTAALVSHLKVQGIERSPGTSFRVPDAEIFLYTGMDNPCDASCYPGTPEYNSCASEISEIDSTISVDNKKSGSVGHAARRLKFLLQWPRRKARKATADAELGDNDSCKSVNVWKYPEQSPLSLRQIHSERPVSLRQRYLHSFSLPNNRAFSFRSNFPSPSAKRKFAAGLIHGVIQATPQKLTTSVQSPSSPLSQSSVTPPSQDKHKNFEISGSSFSPRTLTSKTTDASEKSSPLNKKLMNHYFCFGAQHLAVEDSLGQTQPYLGHWHLSSLAA